MLGNHLKLVRTQSILAAGQELERSKPLARAARAVQLAWRFICSAVPLADLKDRC